MRNLVTLAVIVIAGSILLNASCYIVDEREQVVVTEFGQPVRTVQSPGLHFKIPFIQQLHTFEDRLLYSDADPRQIYTQDKKNLIVDNFARWRITDPLKFLV
ncbi:MAG: SPFH domain-containing protein, partial [Gemmatimonadota bacterium]|nr:SPFH domain-containing protein [Gemmatimonadota bacterium]